LDENLLRYQVDSHILMPFLKSIGQHFSCVIPDLIQNSGFTFSWIPASAGMTVASHLFKERTAMEMKRREFLVRSMAGVGGLLLGAEFAAAQEQRAKKHDPYELVPLGKTGIKVSRVGLGTGMRGSRRQSNHTRMGKEKFDSLAIGCYERGIRLFDLADLYGTHPFLAGALKKMQRKDYAISSKIWFRRGGLPEPERPSPDIRPDFVSLCNV
jgi:hypothetical protein